MDVCHQIHMYMLAYRDVIYVCHQVQVYMLAYRDVIDVCHQVHVYMLAYRDVIARNMLVMALFGETFVPVLSFQVLT